ncbi:hypothetical protein A5714_01940 [Mycobacterium sp. E2462]|nr:hypothetical protein A5714_01940 [Mycobacterium sp. E2462]
MTDFDDDDIDGVDDFDDDLGDPEATGRAAVICRVESLGCRFRFVASVDAALRLAARWPCETAGCLGGHTVVHRDDRGQLRIIADGDEGDEVIGRFSDLLRVREVRRRLRARVNEAARQQRRRAAKRTVLQRGDTDGAD